MIQVLWSTLVPTAPNILSGFVIRLSGGGKGPFSVICAVIGPNMMAGFKLAVSGISNRLTLAGNNVLWICISFLLCALLETLDLCPARNT